MGQGQIQSIYILKNGSQFLENVGNEIDLSTQTLDIVCKKSPDALVLFKDMCKNPDYQLTITDEASLQILREHLLVDESNNIMGDDLIKQVALSAIVKRVNPNLSGAAELEVESPYLMTVQVPDDVKLYDSLAVFKNSPLIPFTFSKTSLPFTVLKETLMKMHEISLISFKVLFYLHYKALFPRENAIPDEKLQLLRQHNLAKSDGNLSENVKKSSNRSNCY